jgi:hypothetical protein
MRTIRNFRRWNAIIIMIIIKIIIICVTLVFDDHIMHYDTSLCTLLLQTSLNIFHCNAFTNSNIVIHCQQKLRMPTYKERQWWNAYFMNCINPCLEVLIMISKSFYNSKTHMPSHSKPSLKLIIGVNRIYWDDQYI